LVLFVLCKRRQTPCSLLFALLCSLEPCSGREQPLLPRYKQNIGIPSAIPCLALINDYTSWGTGNDLHTHSGLIWACELLG
jgi:hypothetical protein